MATGLDPDEEVVEFTTYEKMPSDTNGWVSKKLDAIKQWVALEKVHGANLSFTAQRTDLDTTVSVKVARRNAYLKEGETFFSIHNQKGFLEGEMGKVKQLFEEVSKTAEKPMRAMTVYGELFGGSYPHPSVPAVSKLKPVQQEILYCPDLRFMAFDIAVTSSCTPTAEDDDEDDEDDDDYDPNREYLDYDVCMRLFKSCGMFYPEPLMTGTLQETLDYPLGFKSTIPAKLGLPPLPDDIKNLAEGVVVKPVKNIVLETKRGRQRVIFKRKIEGFRETKPRDKRSQTRGKGTEYNPDYELVKSEMFAMVTQQRLVNVISKIGLPDSNTDSKREVGERWWKIKDGLVNDVLEEMTYEHEELWRNFKRNHAAWMGKIKSDLKKECEMAVKTYREQKV